MTLLSQLELSISFYKHTRIRGSSHEVGMVDDRSVCSCSKAVSVKPNVTLIFVINVVVSPTPNDDVGEKSFLREQTAISSVVI